MSQQQCLFLLAVIPWLSSGTNDPPLLQPAETLDVRMGIWPCLVKSAHHGAPGVGCT